MYKKIGIIPIVCCIFLYVPTAFFGVEQHVVTDFSQVNHGLVHHIEYPKNIMDLHNIMIHTDKPVALAGGKYSMGGQVWIQDGIIIDMKHLHAITAFNPEQKTITVQAGASWKEIQEFLHKYDLTVQVMQSYHDFSIGGSLSVNVHGRDLHGQLIETVQSLTIMLADGSLVKASRTENYDLFSAVIGGYGACGIIVDATLVLEDNYKIKRVMTVVDVDKFLSFYHVRIANQPMIALFNGCLYAPDFDQVISFAWHKTDDPLTIFDPMRLEQGLLQPIKLLSAHYIEYALSEFESAQKIRYLLDKKMVKYFDYVVLRSHEMSHSVHELPASNVKTSKILQEYFIPVKKFNLFVQFMKKVFVDYDIKVLNVSIRHVPKNNESLLTYASEDCFAFVLYIVIDNCPQGHEYARIWTRKLIDIALELKGTYYLPYHLFATQEQFLQAYPGYLKFLAIKQKYDPSNIFQNSLTRAYL